MILNEEQRMIRDMARSFARQQLAPNAAAWEKAGAYPPEIFAEMGKLGLMGMVVPAEWGGSDTGYVSYAIAMMEIAGGDAGLSTIMSVNNSLVCAILAGQGSEAQKEKYLKPLARGETIGCFCLTEAEAGSDAGAIRTRATSEGDGYLLNGTKQFITSGQTAGVAIVFAVTDPEAGKKGLSAFVLPTHVPGYKVARIEEKMGLKASDTVQLVFDNLKLTGENLIGNEGEGYRIALQNLEAGRIGIASQAVGAAQAALDFAIQYAKDRRTFGKAIIEHQAVGFRLADMAARLEAARQLTFHAAALKDDGRPCLKEASMAKLVASETAELVCSAAIQTLGGYGYLSDFPLERIARDVRVCQIYEGTSDVQKLVIARALAAE